VIARLVRERDEARAMLAAYQQGGHVPAASNGGAAAMDMEAPGISDAVQQRMQAKSDELSRTRKGRKAPASLAPKDTIASYTAQFSATPHKASKPGVLSIDVRPGQPNLLLSGGMDGVAVVFDTEANQVVSKLSGHSKKVTHAIFHPDATQQVVVTASADKSVKVWTGGKTHRPLCLLRLSDKVNDL
jgi:pre-mRNA-processing factor 19